MTELKQPPPSLPGFEPVAATVHELPATQSRRRTSKADVIPPDDSTTTLIEAVGKMHRVVMARIAYHEAEAKRLREALKPFAGVPAAGLQANPDALLGVVLDYAKQLRVEGTTDSD